MTQSTAIRKVAAPNLPVAPSEYDQRQQDALANTLRLFFNTLCNAINNASSGTGSVTSVVTSYSPGSFTVATETWRLLGKKMKLTTTQRATIAGTGRLRIAN